MKCPNCEHEIDEALETCPHCEYQLAEEMGSQEGDEEEAVETALLFTAEDELQANIIESLLKVYGIPLRRRYKGNDTFTKIYMGVTSHGIELYVPKTALEEAQSILQNEMPSEGDLEEADIEDIPAEENLGELKEKYDARRRSRAWLSLIFLIPALFAAVGTAIYLLIKLLF